MAGYGRTRLNYKIKDEIMIHFTSRDSFRDAGSFPIETSEVAESLIHSNKFINNSLKLMPLIYSSSKNFLKQDI